MPLLMYSWVISSFTYVAPTDLFVAILTKSSALLIVIYVFLVSILWRGNWPRITYESKAGSIANGWTLQRRRKEMIICSRRSKDYQVMEESRWLLSPFSHEERTCGSLQWWITSSLTKWPEASSLAKGSQWGDKIFQRLFLLLSWGGPFFLALGN